MADALGGDGSGSIIIAVYATLMFDIISESCSSPQTAEINIKSRESTLMKWVKLGLLTAAPFVALGMFYESLAGRSIATPAIGAGMAAGIIWLQYTHARKSGLESTKPGTESYSWNPT